MIRKGLFFIPALIGMVLQGIVNLYAAVIGEVITIYDEVKKYWYMSGPDY